MYGKDIITVVLHDVYKNDDSYFDKIIDWTNSQCPGFVGYRVTDNSNDSYSNDIILEMYFNDKKSASWFQLKWL